MSLKKTFLNTFPQHLWFISLKGVLQLESKLPFLFFHHYHLQPLICVNQDYLDVLQPNKTELMKQGRLIQDSRCHSFLFIAEFSVHKLNCCFTLINFYSKYYWLFTKILEFFQSSTQNQRALYWAVLSTYILSVALRELKLY